MNSTASQLDLLSPAGPNENIVHSTRGAVEWMFLLRAQKTFSRIDHRLGYKKRLIMEFIQNMVFNHNAINKKLIIKGNVENPQILANYIIST